MSVSDAIRYVRAGITQDDEFTKQLALVALNELVLEVALRALFVGVVFGWISCLILIMFFV